MTERTWEPALRSEELGATPRAVVVGGRSLVLWRTASGRLAALDDDCPHQGTALSGGSVLGENLLCPKHNWEVGTDGWCDRASGATAAHRARETDGVIEVRLRA